MRYDTNLAYRLPKEEQAVSQPKIVRVPKAKPAKQVSPVKVLFCMGLVLMMAFSVMYSRAQLTELSAKVTAATKQLEELESENIRLTTELEERISLENVEEYATTQLGLQKLDPAQVQYIALSEGNQIEVKEEVNPTIWQLIRNFFIDMMEYIGL